MAGPCADRYAGPWSASTPSPILLVGTTFDPDTPLAGARRAERLLGNAVLLTHDGYGRFSAADPSTCVTAAIARYLVDLVAPHAGPSVAPTGCRSTERPVSCHRDEAADRRRTYGRAAAPPPGVTMTLSDHTARSTTTPEQIQSRLGRWSSSTACRPSTPSRPSTTTWTSSTR